MTVRHATRAAACALLLTVVTTASPVPAGAQAAGPAVTVSPAVDLLDGQVVQLSGTGFPADTRIFTVQCPPGADGSDDGFACDTNYEPVSTDATGSFTTSVRVGRFVLDGGVDCVAGGCTIGAKTGGGALTATTPTDFLDVPVDEQFTVSPTDDLVDRQTVTVSGTGYPADATIRVVQCGPDATAIIECSHTDVSWTRTDADGAFTAEKIIGRYLPGADGFAIDCAAVACSIGIRPTRTGQFLPITVADVPATTGSITATPSTGLLDDQLVELRGTGFGDEELVSLYTCHSGAYDPTSDRCDWEAAVTGEADASGAFSADLRVERYIDGEDCLEIACAVIAFNVWLEPLGIEAPLSFADVAPTRTIDVLTTDLAEGDPATVVGSGFRPDSVVRIGQCPAAPTSPEECSTETSFATTDSEGAWEAELPIIRVLRPDEGPVVDCAAQTCTVGVTTEPFLPVSGALDVVAPELTVDLHPDATLLAGTNEVVAQLTVSCDTATDIAVRAAVSQPGIEGTWVVERQRCAPDDPLLVFVPTRTFTSDDADFALGDAQLTASVAATDRYLDTDPPSLRTAASGTVELHDRDLIHAAVQAAVADPANSGLRAEVVRAIVVRLRQDPVFRAEWETASTPG